MEFITYEVEGAVAVMTINRPKALNALNSSVLADMDQAGGDGYLPLSEVARKIFDFISGATYALDGKVQKIANNIFIFTPANVSVAAEQSTAPAEPEEKSYWR